MLAKLPKSQHPKAKRALQDIWMAETKSERPSDRNRRRLTDQAVTNFWR